MDFPCSSANPHAHHLHRYSDLTHVGSFPRIQSLSNLSLHPASPLALCTNPDPLAGEVGKATLSIHADFTVFVCNFVARGSIPRLLS